MPHENKGPVAVAQEIAATAGVKKINGGFLNLLILGILAGVYIAFGAQLATLVTHDASAYVGVGLAKMIGGAMFSVGLMLVIIAGAELFTGNNLIFMSVLDRKASFGGLLRNWGIVYVANLLGSLLVVLLIYWSGLWRTGDGAVGAAAVKIASAKVNLTFLEAMTRGILCNWLVCLAVVLAVSSRTVVGKIFACFFPIMAFVASGFEHSVANMYFIPIGMLLKGQGLVEASANLNVSGMIVKNLIPVTIGNIIGGAFFVATLYWIVYVRKARSLD